MSSFRRPDVLAIRFKHSLVLFQLEGTEEELLQGQSCSLSLIGFANFEGSTMLFRQSPFNSREIFILTTGSKIFKIEVPENNPNGCRIEPKLELTVNIAKQ